MSTTKPAKSGRLFGFARRHVGRRFADTLLHRNVILSAFIAGSLTFVSFRLQWFPALTKVQVKDFTAGVLAFTALGFGAGTASTILAIAMPRTMPYLMMIMNGKNAPRMRVVRHDQDYRAEPIGNAVDPKPDYGVAFRSSYGDLLFVFLWTMTTQLAAAVASLMYIAIAGDLAMVDCSHCRRSSLSFAVVVFALSCAIMQMWSLIKTIADYAVQQEAFDRSDLLRPVDPAD